MASFDKKFESTTQDWETPEYLFNMLNHRYAFNFDLAANEKNKKCEAFFSKEDNALEKEWHGRCWLNPPYGSNKDNKLSNWVKKAHNESQKLDCNVVMLLPARTNTIWWHDYCMKAEEILFIKGRPKFGNAKHGLPQPLAIVHFDGKYKHTIYKTLCIKTKEIY